MWWHLSCPSTVVSTSCIAKVKTSAGVWRCSGRVCWRPHPPQPTTLTRRFAVCISTVKVLPFLNLTFCACLSFTIFLRVSNIASWITLSSSLYLLLYLLLSYRALQNLQSTKCSRQANLVLRGVLHVKGAEISKQKIFWLNWVFLSLPLPCDFLQQYIKKFDVNSIYLYF